jgi:hypothetical protein
MKGQIKQEGKLVDVAPDGEVAEQSRADSVSDWSRLAEEWMEYEQRTDSIALGWRIDAGPMMALQGARSHPWLDALGPFRGVSPRHVSWYPG